MKKLLLLACVLFFGIVKSKAQVDLNEFYMDPSAGSHKFFELYNTSVLPHYHSITREQQELYLRF